MYFSKCISQNLCLGVGTGRNAPILISLKMYFSKYIFQNVFLKMYFSKCISQNVFFKMYFSKCIFQNVFLKKYFSKCISQQHYTSSRVRHSVISGRQPCSVAYTDRYIENDHPTQIEKCKQTKID